GTVVVRARAADDRIVVRSHDDDLIVERAARKSRLQVAHRRPLDFELLGVPREAEVVQDLSEVERRGVEGARSSQVPLADPSRERPYVPLEAPLDLGLRLPRGR